MVYDFELMFGGLCFFTFIQTHDPEKPSKARVLLVNATRPNSDFQALPQAQAPHLHVPRLTISAKNLKDSRTGRDRLPDRTFAGSDGVDYAVFDLDLDQLKLVSPGAALSRKLGRRIRPHHKPSESGANPHWFDWCTGLDGSSISDSRLRGLKSTCFDPPTKRGPVIASLEFEVGELQTFEVSKAKGEEILLNFEALDGQGHPASQAGHCLADRLCLHIRGLTDVDFIDLESSAGLIRLGPEAAGASGRSVVGAAITNLHQGYHVPQRRLYDFAWYYTMFEWTGSPPPVGKWLIPAVASGGGYYTPSSGLCPPASSG